MSCMTERYVWCAVTTVLLLTVAAAGQDRGAGSGRSADTTPSGQALFRERCAECHGADAKGVQGHDLTRLWAGGASDDRVFQTIRTGVPNTIMPSSSAPDADLTALVAYLRSLNGTAGSEPARGNAESGARLFWQSCGGCHAVGARGGHLGPELSRAGQTSRDALAQAIREPGSAITPSYQTVTLVTRDGRRIRGTRKSEDAFSIQIMDTHEQLQGYLKNSLREVVHENGSLMPAFGPDRLSETDLSDLLQFLSTLRAADGAGGRGRGRAGR
jgi:putative heme-binding domain-containing protein